MSHSVSKVSVEGTDKSSVEGINNALAKAIHSTPRNFELCVNWNGKLGYISEADWTNLSSNEKTSGEERFVSVR